MAADAVAVGTERDALPGDGGVELDEGAEVPIDDRLVEVGPRRLGRLELGAVGRQVDEADGLGDGEAGRAVPAGIVEHERDDPPRPGARLAGEEGRHVLEAARARPPVERRRKLSPVAGEAKAVTRSHSKR